MSETIAIRAGDARDHGFVLDLGQRTVMDSVAAFRDPIPAMVHVSYERLLRFAFDQPHLLFVAHDGERRLGFLLLLDTLPDEVTMTPQAFIAYTAVEPFARRKGVASSLLERAEAYARTHGLPYMSLMVTEDNLPARALYERAGFVTERRLLCKIL
jgi:ribosomal protein S18 acetylase RimI-like enzyme